ncbi:MAG: S8 family serine peptidase [Desulfomonile tiedjei]|nr:S8 family serine peptidase [Desulfomonile tiedjei]
MYATRRLLVSVVALSACLCLVWIGFVSGENAGFTTPARDRSGFEANDSLSAEVKTIFGLSPAPSQEIRIFLSVDRPSVEAGDAIAITAETDRDCFLTVLNVGTPGRIIRLWPNAYSGPDNRVRANTPIRIPPAGAPFMVILDGSRPVEKIVAYATTEQGTIFDEADFQDHSGGGTRTVFRGDHVELVDTFSRRVKQLPHDVRWGTAQADVRIGRAGASGASVGLVPVIVEMQVPREASKGLVMKRADGLSALGFRLDDTYEPLPIEAGTEEMESKLLAAGEEVVLVRGALDESRLSMMEKEPGVIGVWRDDEFEFCEKPCPKPFTSCDCKPGEPKGTLLDVAKYLGVDKLWAEGYRGEGVVIGIVDDGIRAEGRYQGTEKKIARVIGGYPENWGTMSDNHGMMTATDALGMAPDAKILDIRILGKHGSDIAKAYTWVVGQFQRHKTPQILSNSWGASAKGVKDQRSFPRNPKHPVNRKVAEAMQNGIIVLFAAANCGETCPDQRCGEYVGPGKSIWAPGALSEVMTVAAVNLREEWVGYSSQGPSAVEKNKPDFASITHFTGWAKCDNGTSAACPVAAGVVALLKGANPRLSQQVAKKLLMETAKQIGEPGWNAHTGAGIIRPKLAFDRMMGR